MRHLSVFAVVLAALAAAAAAPRAAGTAPAYTRVDLGSLGGAWTMPKALGESGVVTGYGLLDAGAAHAFLWTRADGMTDLGVFGSPAGVNSAGTAIGYGVGADGNKHAFAWSTAGVVDLGRGDAYGISDSGFIVGETNPGPHPTVWTPAGDAIDVFAGTTADTGRAYDVNEQGLVVGIGYSNPQGSTFYPFSWTQAGGLVRLAPLVPGANANALAVNNQGQVVGISSTAQFRPHGVVWNPDGSVADVGDLGGMSSIPMAISDTGRVVGWSSTADFFTHAFSWTPAGGIVDLGTLGGPGSQASDVNDDGLVVGHALTPLGEQHAAAWTADGIVDLGLPGEISTAIAVNDAGQILGYTGRLGVDARAVIWESRDTTPPTLAAPARVEVDATTPAGAIATFEVTAADDRDPSPVVTLSQASGTWFAIGDTTVTCTATDSSGNTATATFVVHVRGAGEQLDRLASRVAESGAPPGIANSLLAKLGSPDVQRLGAFAHEIDAQAGKALTSDEAAELGAAAERLVSVLGG